MNWLKGILVDCKTNEIKATDCELCIESINNLIDAELTKIKDMVIAGKSVKVFINPYERKKPASMPSR